MRTIPGASFETGLDSLVLTSEQSNTSLVFGETQLDLSQQEALVATQRAAIPPLEVTVGQNIAALAVLVARAPANLTVHGGSTSQIVVPRVTPGLPSELLYQRPDIRQAEALLASSNFSVEAARAAFFPQIQLTGTTGFQSQALASLFTPGAWFYTLTARGRSELTAKTDQWSRLTRAMNLILSPSNKEA